MPTPRRFLTALALAGLSALPGALTAAENLTLWYQQPAKNDMDEALPVGNGRIGASVFGGVERERLQLNENSLWTGNDKGDYQTLGDLFLDFATGPAPVLDKFSLGCRLDRLEHGEERISGGDLLGRSRLLRGTGPVRSPSAVLKYPTPRLRCPTNHPRSQLRSDISENQCP